MTWNVGEYIESQMLDRFGFEGPGPVLQRRVDDQHMIQVTISPFNRGAGPNRAGVEFALGRRDINELQDEVFGGSRPARSWRAGVLELRGDHRFLGRPDGHRISSDASPSDVDAFLERWVPPLDGIANLAFIEEYMATDDPGWGDETRDRVKQIFWSTSVANRMLSGWSPESDEHFLQWQIDSVAHFDADSRRRVNVEGQVVSIREWIAENPDGVERELTG